MAGRSGRKEIMTLNDFLLGSKAGLTPAEATAALPHLLTQQQAATDALQSATAEVQAAQAKVDDDSAHSQFLRTRLNDTTKALSAFDSTLSDELNGWVSHSISTASLNVVTSSL
jgi:hypothetical protein